MSKPTKLRGGQESELTKLKDIWRGLSDDARAFWRERFGSKETQASTRALLLSRLQVNLRFDKQLNQFRDWVNDQDRRDAAAERLEENDARLRAEHPDWTIDQVREAVLNGAYREALASGDFKLGLQTVDRDLNARKVTLDSRKLALLEKKAEAYDRAQAALADAKKSKGGVTPETFAKVEAELKLL